MFLDVTIPEIIQTIIILGNNQTIVKIGEYAGKYPRVKIIQNDTFETFKHFGKIISPKFLTYYLPEFGNTLFLCDKKFVGLQDISAADKEISGDYILEYRDSINQRTLSRNEFYFDLPYNYQVDILAFDVELETPCYTNLIEAFNSKVYVNQTKYTNSLRLSLTAFGSGITFSSTEGYRLIEADRDYYEQLEFSLFYEFLRLAIDWEQFGRKRKIDFSSSRLSHSICSVLGKSSFTKVPNKIKREIEIMNLNQLVVNLDSQNRGVLLIEPQEAYKDYTTITIDNNSSEELLFDNQVDQAGYSKAVIKYKSSAGNNYQNTEPTNICDEAVIKILVRIHNPLQVLSNIDVFATSELSEVLVIGSNVRLCGSVKSLRAISCGITQVYDCLKVTAYNTCTLGLEARTITETHKEKLIQYFVSSSNVSFD